MINYIFRFIILIQRKIIATHGLVTSTYRLAIASHRLVSASYRLSSSTHRLAITSNVFTISPHGIVPASPGLAISSPGIVAASLTLLIESIFLSQYPEFILIDRKYDNHLKLIFFTLKPISSKISAIFTLKSP